MILILILVTSFIQIIDVSAKRYRVMLDDDLYPYTLENDVESYKDYYNIDNIIFEQIDDDQVRGGGYGVVIKSMDPNMIMHGSFRTQHEENGIWREGTLRMNVLDMCAEFLNPLRPWYNLTKLWTTCPPQAGGKWFVEDQIINVIVDLPPSFSKGRWRVYFLLYQGVVKATTKMGIMFQMEFFEIV